MKGLNDEENAMIEKLWARYHDGGLAGLPSQVYFDIGWLHGLVSKLAAHVEAAEFCLRDYEEAGEISPIGLELLRKATGK